MTITGKILIPLFLLILITGCKKKKQPSLSAETRVEVSDFVGFFPPLDLPFQFNDSSLQLNHKEKDSLLISYKVFTQFVPDSVITNVYGKGAKPKFYAMGKAIMPGAETYLFVKAVQTGKKSVFILCFDKKLHFVAAMAALRPDQNSATNQAVLFDRQYTITKSMLRKNKDGSQSEGKDVYAFNPESKSFYLVMTDALEDKITELINPIDTLPAKNKWSADYIAGKINLVSVRDGRRNNELTFFIHFDKNDGECTGELKGEAVIISGNTAEYRRDGDPCKLKFIFKPSAVEIKEIEGCGSRRPLKCSFDGSFARKKDTKKKAPPVKGK